VGPLDLTNYIGDESCGLVLFAMIARASRRYAQRQRALSDPETLKGTSSEILIQVRLLSNKCTACEAAECNFSKESKISRHLETDTMGENLGPSIFPHPGLVEAIQFESGISQLFRGKRFYASHPLSNNVLCQIILRAQRRCPARNEYTRGSTILDGDSASRRIRTTGTNESY
jgi:hypothetical protein